MSDKHRRLSPYVRNEDTLQRGIEQTALAQTRAAMTPTAAQVLKMLAEWIENKQDKSGDGSYRSMLQSRLEEIEERIVRLYSPAHLRALAQAHADQQAQLTQAEAQRDRLLAGLEGIWPTRRAYAAVKACADELEAALGGKEND